MRKTKTLFKLGQVEFNMRKIQHEKHTYLCPNFFHNKVCDWYDIYGCKYLNTIYFMIISHIDK